jgi:hypothetical protein
MPDESRDAAVRFSQICHTLFGSKPISDPDELRDVARELEGWTVAEVENAVRKLGKDPTRSAQHRPKVFEVVRYLQNTTARAWEGDATGYAPMWCPECGYQFAVELGESEFCHRCAKTGKPSRMIPWADYFRLPNQRSREMQRRIDEENAAKAKAVRKPEPVVAAVADDEPAAF